MGNSCCKIIDSAGLKDPTRRCSSGRTSERTPSSPNSSSEDVPEIIISKFSAIEEKTFIRYCVDMPGVRPHDMDIEFEGATLAISGFRYKNISVGSTPGAPVEDGKKVTSKYMLTLPVKVGADIPNARVDYGGYGVLNVTIPIVRTRKIEIQEV